MIRLLAAWGIGLTLMVGCTGGGSDPDPNAAATATSSSSPSEGPDPDGGNGTLFTTKAGEGGTELTISALPIDADGSLGEATEVRTAPADDTSFPVVIDGVGPALLTGTAKNYWTTQLQVYESGELVNEIPAKRWCGGEGLSYNQCVMLDAQTMARTTDLGRDPGSGEGPEKGSVIISSLEDGSRLAKYGPFPDLTHILGTDSPEQLLLVSTEFTGDEDVAASSTVQRLNLTDGTTTEVATSPPGWTPTCAVDADSVLGGTVLDGYQVVVLGSAAAAEIRIDDADPAGCSADGRFLYTQRYSGQGQGGQEGAADAAEPSVTVDRIDIFSGESAQVAEPEPGTFVALITR